MPLDIVTPPISSSITRQDRWQAHLPHTDRTAKPSKASLFETSAAAEIQTHQDAEGERVEMHDADS